MGTLLARHTLPVVIGTEQPQTRAHLEQQKPRLTIVILVIGFDPIEFMFPDELLDERCAEG